MSTKTHLLLLATTALAGSLLASAAAAQSTGTTDVEAVVVTGRTGPKTIDGEMLAENTSKNRSTITQEFIATQSPGQTILQTLNLTPGLSFSSSDAYGSSGGTIRLHGQDGAHIGLLIDGVPLNDAGNYSLYSNQQLDPELISQASINTGSTDVDTVTASSTAGVINYTTRKASDKFGVEMNGSYGSYNYGRVFGLIDSGAIGPFGTRAYVAGSYQSYDKFKGPGDLEKKQLNLRIDQPLRAPGDFMSLLVNYNENRNTFYYNPNLSNASGSIPAEVDQYGWNLDYFSNWIPVTKTPGVADTVPAQNSATRGFYGYRSNPSNTGTIRGLSRFSLLPNLHLTVDPAFNYSLANGGGVTTLKEGSALQIVNPAGVGHDINGDGDALDDVLTYSPSITNTRRYSVNTSLIWDINSNNLVRFAYAYDRAKTRQTGEYSLLTSGGFPMSPFSAKDGYDATPVLNGLGQKAQKRDRTSIAEMNQFALEYRGRYLNDRLSFNIGVRIPELTRDLNQYCYSVAGSTTATCTVRTPATSVKLAPDAVANAVTFAGSTTRYFAPFHAVRKFDAVLPNVGAVYRLTPSFSLYGNYSESQSAPKVDNLYTVTSLGQLGQVKPETSQSMDYGVRYQARRMIAQLGGYHTVIDNRIVSTRDPNDDTFIDRNVGKVEINGVDAQVTFRPADPITVYLTGSYTDAKLQNDLFVGGAAIYPGAGLPAGWAPLKGKQLVETPEYTFAGRVTYDFGLVKLGLQGKYTGERYVTDANDLSVPGFLVVDFDAQMSLERVRKGMMLQFNVINLFDDKHYGALQGTTTTAVTGAPGYSLPYAAVGARRAAVVTLKAAF
jgi:iron complex outermembrane receptor protein